MSQPYFNQFEYLSQEQRDDLRAEIFAEELIKMIIEMEKKKAESQIPEEEIVS